MFPLPADVGLRLAFDPADAEELIVALEVASMDSSRHTLSQLARSIRAATATWDDA